MSPRNVDLDKFRLRSFAEKLIAIGEMEVHEEAVPLADLSAVIEASSKAKYFKRVGAEQYEMVGAVSGSRRRLAAAFGTDERNVIHEYMRRMNDPQPIVEVPSSDAPVHQVVLEGDDIDLAKLPFHLQHELDGAPYISSGIDYSVDPATGRTNVGCRRLMFRDRRTMRANLSQPSDLKNCYIACVERGQTLPASFAIGSHPLDYLAAGLRLPTDEFALVATLRGEPVPMVRGLTNGVLAPADAEMIIEGYFDALGYREQEGPYGEFYGFYGPVHMDPVFHVTAVTMRKDALHQTVFHSGDHLGWTSRATRRAQCRTAGLEGLARRRHRARRTVGRAGIERTATRARRTAPGAARPSAARDLSTPCHPQGEARLRRGRRRRRLFRGADGVGHGDPLPSGERYRDRDRLSRLLHGPDPDENGLVDKAGFDLTAPYGIPDTIETRRPRAPRFKAQRRHDNASEALKSGPMFFYQIMEALGSTDGREVALELHALHEQGTVTRLRDGEWALKDKQV